MMNENLRGNLQEKASIKEALGNKTLMELTS